MMIGYEIVETFISGFRTKQFTFNKVLNDVFVTILVNLKCAFKVSVHVHAFRL